MTYRVLQEKTVANPDGVTNNFWIQGSIGWTTYHEQLIAEGCKRLIMNAINYWNLLHLTDKIQACPKLAAYEELLVMILRSNTHTWHHVNLQQGCLCHRVRFL
ncbi:Tn3 family transposase [Cytophagaceae bacterium SJW1-29]|uniref:Tn3 family transposase n=1 Tax=Salmonirosea aquatica TaxID=2654236 RepID=A0A7C9BJ75_9BACT|nr:Tn3 family transposase [Cytophagaceae bacterium SJW1-29]